MPNNKDTIPNKPLPLKAMSKYPTFDEYYKMIPLNKRDTTNYDLRSYYNQNPSAALEFIKPNTHAPDTYKLPSHITFSNESIYHSNKTPGGKWAFENGKDVFYPSPLNIKNAGGVEKLKEYFSKYEPNVKLIIK